ncbi:MAG TPA: hypothetical protein PLT78_15030 [Ignavibacteriaceae bacterium]|nr:hypothetical protein [Ignavibacteriaceae bacterium]
MKRVRVRNNFIVYSLFDFSEIILARLLTLSLSAQILLGWRDAADLCFTTSQ